MKNIWFIDISYWPEVLTGLLEVVFEEGTPFQQVKHMTPMQKPDYY